MSFQGRRVIALIPARGGSKGLLRKNLIKIDGKTLVEHSLCSGFDSLVVDEVFLSSDDEEILEVGRKVGAKLHIRSPGAALDESTATDVINDFLNTWAEEDIKSNPFVVYLQPTSPLRKAVDIDAAFKVIEADGGDSCISVVELIKTPFKSFILNKSGRLQTLFDEKFSNANRQVLKKAYYPNGAIYIFTVNKFLENGGIPSNGAIPFEMTSVNSIDVDTEIDLLEIMKTWPKN